MRFDLVTIFPKVFDSYLKESLIKRALNKKIIRIKVWNLRDFAGDKHKTVDDRPFGGGPGMVLKIEPIYKAVKFLTKDGRRKLKNTRIILFSTRGRKLNAKIVRRLAKYDRLILICGRYEGVDERVAKYIADEEISIGDYILSGGELPALATIEAVSRFLPGFLGKYESLEENKGSYPVYTRPGIFNKWRVPEVLLSGNHKEVEKWRRKRFS